MIKQHGENALVCRMVAKGLENLAIYKLTQNKNNERQQHQAI